MKNSHLIGIIIVLAGALIYKKMKPTEVQTLPIEKEQKTLIAKEEQEHIEKKKKRDALLKEKMSQLKDKTYTKEEFIRLTEKYLDKLPSKKDLMEKTSKQVHHTPELVMRAGYQLGNLKEILKKQNELKQYAIPFYQKCADQKEGLVSVRALCLSNLIFYKKEMGESFEIENYPPRVKELALTILN